MKKIVSLLAILALVFAMVAFVGCDNGNGGTPGKSDVVDDSDPVETFTPPENVVKEIELVKNPYADGGALETQVKIPTNFDSLAVGDKVRLVMKGAVNPALGKMEICLVDTTQAADWWKMLDGNKYEAEDMVNFDIDYTFTVTTAPVGTGSESMMIVINGKDNDVTKKMYCTEFSVTKVEPTPVVPATVVLMENEAGYTKDWSADDNAFTADKFKDAVSGSAIVFTISKNTDQYYDGDYDDCYSLIQLLDGDDKLTSGTLEGGRLGTENLEPHYLLDNGEPNYDESAVYKMTYYPSDDEIAVLKARGVKVQAHGTKIYKIEFVPVAE